MTIQRTEPLTRTWAVQFPDTGKKPAHVGVGTAVGYGKNATIPPSTPR